MSGKRRWADALFVLACVAATVFLMWLASGFTFWNDAWAFIKTADDWSVNGLMQPHNEHWQLLNKLVHKTLMATVGMRTYVPYQVIAVLLHIAIAAGIYTYARRQTHALVALGAAVIFLFLGSGAEDYFMAFQMGYNGAAAAGTWALLILLREPRPRHAWLAAVLLVIAVMSMGVGLFFVAAALAVIVISPPLRRYWWVAVPAVAIYGAWYLAYGSGAVGDLPGLQAVAVYVRNGITHAVGQISGLRAEVGLVLAVLLAIVALGNLASSDKLRLGLFAGSVGLLSQYVITGLARADTLPDSYLASRYVHVAAIFVLIAFVSWLGRRELSRPGERFRLVVAVGVVVGISLLWNVNRAFFLQDRWESNIDQNRASIALMLTYGGSPAIPDDRGMRLIPGGEVRPVGPGERALIPGPSALADLFERFGSPLQDPLAIRGVAVPPRTTDRAFMDLVRDAVVILPGVVPTGLAPLDVVSIEDAQLQDDGSCQLIETSGGNPRVRMTVPSGSRLFVSSDSGGSGEYVVSINGTYSGDPEPFDIAADEVRAVQIPDIGPGHTVLVELRPPFGGLRLCLEAAQSP